MGKLIREKDWSESQLGEVDSWPQSLRTLVSMLLENPVGMYIAWGKEYIQLYNDNYSPIFSTTKHTKALGISARHTYADIFSSIEPMFESAMNGIPVVVSDFMVPLNRNGYLSNVFQCPDSIYR